MAGTVLAWSSPGLSYLKSNENSPFRPTDEEGSWIGSLAALGAACGPFSAGYLSDNVGRKLTMLCEYSKFFYLFLIISAQLIF